MSDRHHHTGREDEGDSDWLRSALSTINRKLDTIMTTLADISAAVAAEQTVQASVITLLETLSADLTAALASGDQTAMEAIVTQIDTNAAALASAVTANTPAATTTPTVPATGS